MYPILQVLIGERLDGQEVDDTQRSDCSCSSAPTDVRVGLALPVIRSSCLIRFLSPLGKVRRWCGTAGAR